MACVTLRVIDGADRGRVFRDLALPITIGREEGNTIQLNDERVSRFHLKIQEDKKRFVLTDLDSTNGTKVNGQDTHLHVLNFGDTVGVGRSLILFGSEDEIRRRLELIEGLDTEGSATLGLQEIVRADEKRPISNFLGMMIQKRRPPFPYCSPPRPLAIYPQARPPRWRKS